LRQASARILGSHELFANEHGVRTTPPNLLKVLDGTHAAHEDRHALRRDSFDASPCGLLVDAEGAQVPRVDPNDRRTCIDRSIDLVDAGRFDDRFHPERTNMSDQVVELGIREGANE